MKIHTHIVVLYAIIALLLILSTQRHTKLNTTVQVLKEFQQKSSETRLHFMTEIDEIRNRLAVLEHKNGYPKIITVRPVDSVTGNRK